MSLVVFFGKSTIVLEVDGLVGLVVNVRLESGRPGVRIPLAMGFFWVESYQ